MKRLIPAACIFILTTFAYGNAWAVTAQQYVDFKNEDGMNYYINGLGEGMGWANIALVNRGEAPLYCQPGKLAITMDNYIMILDNFIEDAKKKNKYRAEDPVGMYMLIGLQRTFPCK